MEQKRNKGNDKIIIIIGGGNERGKYVFGVSLIVD